MSPTRVSPLVCLTAAILGGLAGALVEPAAAQAPPTARVVPEPYRLATANAMPTLARGPLARLVRNPDRSGGLPPYALTDQTGTIQRYVEPVPRINLEPYVGTVVTVRHDTGQTLLASQLDLPALSLSSEGGYTAGRPGAALATSGVCPAQHVEALSPDAQFLPDGVMPVEPIGPTGNLPPCCTPPFAPSMEPIDLDSMSAEMAMPPGVGPCPSCGGFHARPNYKSVVGRSFATECAACPQPEPWRLYANAEINYLRVRLAAWDLSEHYDLSPRVILGVENSPWLDARVRYWQYHQTTPILTGGDVRFEFDVLDVEATSKLQGRRTDVVLAGGLRLADIDIEGVTEGQFALGSDLMGLTLAADVQTRVFSSRLGQLGVVYGGRLSLLGGNWSGAIPVYDDNMLVHELYGGVEYLHCFRRFDVHARVTAEWQNWHSDVLADSGFVQSIGFFGPSAQVGISF